MLCPQQELLSIGLNSKPRPPVKAAVLDCLGYMVWTASSSFTDSPNCLKLLKIKVHPSYKKVPELRLNDLGLPEKEYYTTQDICKVLGIIPDTFRYRLRRGIYPEVKKVGGKRCFSLQEARQIVKIQF